MAALLVVAGTLAGCATEESGPVGPSKPLPSRTAELGSLDGKFISPDGADDAPGTAPRPWRTFEAALPRMNPGETLYVRGGTYHERVKLEHLPAGRQGAPITVQAVPGERPVVQGLFWLAGAEYWTFDGINVTWSERNSNFEHMVKLEDGHHWTWRDSEIWGARSFANILVAGRRHGEPSSWTLADNCIHDTIPTNDARQDNNIYVGNMLDGGPGRVTGNLVFGAPNGRNIKLGGAESVSSVGPDNVTVRHNTLADAAVPVVVAGGAKHNLIEQNLMADSDSGYLVRGYQLTGGDNVVRGNVGTGDSFIAPGSGNLQDGGGNQLIDSPDFGSTAGCAGYRPGDSRARAVGYPD